MRNPYLRLFLITANVIVWSALIIGSLRYVGNQQSYTQFNHPLLKNKSLKLFQTNSPESITQILNIPKNITNIVPIINLEFRGDYWHIVQVLGRNPYKSVSILPFDDFLNTYDRSSLGINVVNKQLHKLGLLTDSLKSKPDLNIIFTSETTAVLLEVRKKQPKWIYMSSHSLIAKFQLMGSIYLETITQVNEDLIYLHTSDELKPRLQKEMLKRNKHLIFNIDQQDSFKPTGIQAHFFSTHLDKLLALK